MNTIRLIELAYSPLTIDGAKQSAVIDAAEGHTIAYQVSASSASSPTGTAIQIQGSLDGTNFFNLGSSVNVTDNGQFSVALADLPYRYYRLSYTRSSGSYVATTRVLVKGSDI